MTAGASEETRVAIHDTDEGVRGEADEQRDDTTGHLEVPGPRSPSAARLLEITARETDQWRADARAEADGIVAAAKDEAAALVRDAQRDADRVLDEARQTAARTVADAHADADAVRSGSEHERAQVESEVARLRQVADDHSERLRRHLHDVLERLDSAPGGSAPRHDTPS